MTKRLTAANHNILERRPCIDYIEPPVVSTPPKDLTEAANTAEDGLKRALLLAQAVNILAEALQAKADLRAQNMAIKLVNPVDIAAIAAMRRLHPNANPNEITYDQYKQCKERLRNRGENIANDVLQLDPAVGNINDQNEAAQAGGFGTEEAKNGGLRPELDKKMQIIDPIDLDKFQIKAIKIVVNYFWKKWIRPGLIAFFISVGGPIGLMATQLPKHLFHIKKTKGIGIADDDTEGYEDIPEDNLVIPDESQLQQPTSATNNETKESVMPEVASADCMTIAKAFERGASYCATEESVFALMTPILTGMRATSATFIRIWQDNKNLEGTEAGQAIATLDQSTAENGTTLQETLAGNIQKLDISKCIPCSFRMVFKVDFAHKFKEALAHMIQQYYQYFKDALAQIMDMLKFFDMEKYTVHMCTLRNVLGMMCVPDLRRIIAAFMMLLMKMALQINSVFDLMMSIVAPLMLPFLMGLMVPLEQFFLAVIQPLECVIQHIAMEIEKLDYGQLFDARGLTISVGPQGKHSNITLGNQTLGGQTVGGDKIPYTDWTVPTAQVPSLTVPSTTVNDQKWGFTYNPVKSLTNVDTEKENVEAAERELNAIKAAGGNIDMNNAVAREQYMTQLEAAREKRNQALTAQSNKIQEAAKAVRQVGQSIKSVLIMLQGYIREAIEMVQGFIANLVGEVKKLMESVLGGNGTLIFNLYKKLAIVQLMSIIVAVIKWLGKAQKCDTNTDPNLDLTPSSVGSGLIVRTDEDGTVHVEEDPNRLKDALERVRQIGTQESLAGTRQKLGSLVELTGDPLLDANITQALDTMTKPANVLYKCPLQTSTEDIQRVNRYIQELSAT